MYDDKNSLPEDFLDDKPIIIKSLFKILAILGITAAVLAVAAYFAFDWAMSAVVHSRKEVQVPDISKKPAVVALDLLANANLAMRKAGEEYQPDLLSGSVIRQLPPAGTVVREGKVVRVWLSQGSQSIEVPDLSGLALRNAELVLRQMHLTVGTKDTAYSLTIERGAVISQDPAAGALAVKDSEVNLVVSGGNPPSAVLLMPDFRHKKIADVNLWASDANISVEITEDEDSPFPNGTIIKQTPLPDSEITPDSGIEITVSARPLAAGEQLYRIHYELPQGKNTNRVKIVMQDELGEREILNEVRQPGSKIDLSVPYGDNAAFRIYVDGILVREKEMK
ncbi:MAG: PASTA domain-containing protein [Elusimicrobiota bacterium]|jgi:serine/threonine-protein kinase|nr:PASTA domain-containing protein [Elusimicrobiota bacterium]